MTDSIPIVQQVYFNRKKQEIFSYKISGKDGLLAIKEYKYAEDRINELVKIQNDAARGQSITTTIDPMLAEKFKNKAIEWLADHQIQVSDTGGYIYSHSQRREDFETYIAKELKKEEAEIVKYVSGERITYNKPTELADMSKIEKNTGGITEGRKKPKKFTIKEEKEDEGVIKNKRLVKKEKIR